MSTSSPTTLDLESRENLAAVRREWTAEQIGWCVAAMALLAASLGATGPGLLSERKVSSSNGTLHVRYSAIERYESPTEIEIDCRPRGAQRNFVVRIARSLIDRTSEQHFTPAPLASVIDAHAIAYTFAAGSTAGEPRILFRFQHTKMGRVHGEIQFADDASVSITQLVLP